ncbi:MAG: YkgJ family cysteine cluster protein [Spirochaetota bacterium]|nr:YkgJ family cysteine cluster protein [Spirochaetota bacterium]
MSVVRKDGFDFSFDPKECKSCLGRCCRGETGNVWVNQYDILQISQFLKINTIDCIQNYLILIDGRFSIKDCLTGSGYNCIFLDDTSGKCKIYAARPEQCRQYPFWERFRKHQDELFQECPGISKDKPLH